MSIFLVKVWQVKIWRYRRENNIFDWISLLFFYLSKIVIMDLLVLMRWFWFWFLTVTLWLLLFIILLLRFGDFLLNWVHLLFVFFLRYFLDIFSLKRKHILRNFLLLNMFLLCWDCLYVCWLIKMNILLRLFWSFLNWSDDFTMIMIFKIRLGNFWPLNWRELLLKVLNKFERRSKMILLNNNMLIFPI